MGQAISKPFDRLFPGSPEGFDEPWVLHFHCFLLRADSGWTALVDTGIGGVDSPAASWAPVPGVLESELAAAGVTPAEVDTVILTHLHSDHASGAVVNGEPLFPNAWYVVQRAELDEVAPAIQEEVVGPLADRLRVVAGDHRDVAPGLHVQLTPGHTPGHQIARLGELAMTGDLVLHPVQLADPQVRYAYDHDQELAARSRAEVLAGLRAEGAILGTGHFPEPFVDLGPRS